MPFYQSPQLFIDFARLPPPKVIEEIDYEALLDVYKQQVLAKNGDLEAALKLEQSATNIILQAEAYGEMLVRARVNAAARSVMLAFATGSDLDQLAALFNVERAVVDDTVTPIVMESDTRLRRRVQESIEGFSTAGSPGSYVVHSLNADPTIRDAAATKAGPGKVLVSLMASGSNPTATADQIRKVRDKLLSKNIKPLTDMVAVKSAEVIETDIDADVILYPGPVASLVMSDVNKSLTSLRERIGWIGRDLTRSALFAAINQEGVQDVVLRSPAADIVASPSQLVWIKTAKINVLTERRE